MLALDYLIDADSGIKVTCRPSEIDPKPGEAPAFFIGMESLDGLNDASMELDPKAVLWLFLKLSDFLGWPIVWSDHGRAVSRLLRLFHEYAPQGVIWESAEVVAVTTDMLAKMKSAGWLEDTDTTELPMTESSGELSFRRMGEMIRWRIKGIGEQEMRAVMLGWIFGRGGEIFARDFARELVHYCLDPDGMPDLTKVIRDGLKGKHTTQGRGGGKFRSIPVDALQDDDGGDVKPPDRA